MNFKSSIQLAFASLVVGSALIGCGSGEADVDPKAMDARNGQRQAQTAGGTPPAATTGQ